MPKLKPANELAALSAKPYPNDSDGYRTARTALLVVRSNCVAISSVSQNSAGHSHSAERRARMNFSTTREKRSA